MPKAYTDPQDKHITREIHRLFWTANWQAKWSLIATYIARTMAYILQSLLIPLFIAFGLEAIISKNFDAVWSNAWAVLASIIGYGILSGVGSWAVSFNALKGSSFVQQKIFTNYLQKDFDFYNNAYFGALGSQATRMRDLCSEYGKIMTLDVPRHTVTIGGSLIIIGLQSPLLALISVVCIFLVLSYTIWTSRWRMKFRRDLSVSSSEVAGVVGDALSHAHAVKSFSAESYEEKRLSESLEPWRRSQFLVWVSSIPADVGRNLLAAITIVLLLIATAYLFQNGEISIAIVALVQLYVIRMISTTAEIAESIKTYETVMGAAHQSMHTMLVEPTVLDPSSPRKLSARKKLSITFDNVRFKYSDAKDAIAIKDFALTIKPGEKIGLVGHSGSGKTTLTKLLLRFMDTTGGAIKLGGIDIRDTTQKDLRQAIGYVPQEPLLFHRSIRENIAYGKPGASRQAIIKAAKMAHVDEFVQDLPDKYDTMVGERGVKLSGGQRQRVAIARAILKNAPILVLDEATSALDSESEQLIQAALWKLIDDRTALVVAHRLSTIQRMDKIIVMHKGKIAQMGTHKELLAEKAGIYAKLWSHQSGGYLVDE